MFKYKCPVHSQKSHNCEILSHVRWPMRDVAIKKWAMANVSFITSEIKEINGSHANHGNK